MNMEMQQGDDNKEQPEVEGVAEKDSSCDNCESEMDGVEYAIDPVTGLVEKSDDLRNMDRD